jgi:hypothetical protein
VGDDYHYHRLENEAGIDLMVAALVEKLKSHNILDNTYILYTSDNGFHIGNHRLNPGKRCGYETDINIPLFIRGPGVPKNVQTSITNSHTDIAPTVLTMLGLPLRSDFDGQPIAYTANELANSKKSEYVNVEFWDAREDQREAQPGSYYNNTYKSLRLATAGQSFYYSVWCDGEHEFYDMKVLFSALTLRDLDPLTLLVGRLLSDEQPSAKERRPCSKHNVLRSPGRAAVCPPGYITPCAEGLQARSLPQSLQRTLPRWPSLGLDAGHGFKV